MEPTHRDEAELSELEALYLTVFELEDELEAERQRNLSLLGLLDCLLFG